MFINILVIDQSDKNCKSNTNLPKFIKEKDKDPYDFIIHLYVSKLLSQ